MGVSGGVSVPLVTIEVCGASFDMGVSGGVLIPRITIEFCGSSSNMGVSGGVSILLLTIGEEVTSAANFLCLLRNQSCT